MRTVALATILICELLITMLMLVGIDSTSINFISTLVVVVITAFTLSAILQNIKNLSASKKYGISGLLGVVIGLLYYWWASKYTETVAQWLKTDGVYFLLAAIFLCALFLFFKKGSKNKKTSTETPQI